MRAGQYRIDLVVEGNGDARLAIECDGDRYHGSDKWADDQHRQRVLERAGWVFWRCFASTYTRRKQIVLADLLRTLTEREIEPTGGEGAPRSVHTELRRWRASAVATQDEDTALEEEAAEVGAVREAVPQGGSTGTAVQTATVSQSGQSAPREQARARFSGGQRALPRTRWHWTSSRARGRGPRFVSPHQLQMRNSVKRRSLPLVSSTRYEPGTSAGLVVRYGSNTSDHEGRSRRNCVNGDSSSRQERVLAKVT